MHRQADLSRLLPPTPYQASRLASYRSIGNLSVVVESRRCTRPLEAQPCPANTAINNRDETEPVIRDDCTNVLCSNTCGVAFGTVKSGENVD